MNFCANLRHRGLWAFFAIRHASCSEQISRGVQIARQCQIARQWLEATR